MAKRTKDLQVNMEPHIHTAVVDLSAKLGMSASSYIRSLIIRDLRERGVVTNKQLADMALVS